MDEFEKEKFNELCLKKILNTEPRVNYNEEMWFDYQSLFDKVKCAILEIDNDIEIKHIDFSDAKFKDIRYALFGDSDYEEKLSKILKGDIDAIDTAAYNLYGESKKHKYYYQDYCYLCSTIIAFDRDIFSFQRYREDYGPGPIPDVLKERNLFKVNYSDILELFGR